MSILAQIVIAAMIFAAGAAGGIRWHAGKDAVAELARQENQRAVERMRRQNTNTAATGHEQDKEKIRTEFRTITQEVERVVTQVEYRDRVCFDDSGLRLINDAIRATGDTGVVGNPMPAASASQ